MSFLKVKLSCVNRRNVRWGEQILGETMVFTDSLRTSVEGRGGLSKYWGKPWFSQTLSGQVSKEEGD